MDQGPCKHLGSPGHSYPLQALSWHLLQGSAWLGWTLPSATFPSPLRVPVLPLLLGSPSVQRWLGVGTCLTLYGGYRHGPQGRMPALPVPRGSLDPGLRVPGVATAEASQAESQQEKEAALRGQGVGLAPDTTG